ncbi:hypothetical protein JW921_02050 [Candidatus Fermentibacterales bacterium]|nr:hypothetical protein [Candidatus Fermentibacterales bacterium]
MDATAAAAASVLRSLFDLLLYPTAPLSPTLALCLVSVLSGLAMIALFRLASDQEAIASVRRRMGAEAVGMLLYLGDPSTVLRKGWRLISLNFVYLYHLIGPMLVMALPLLLLIAQIGARYSLSPPAAGDTAVITLSLSDPIAGLPPVVETSSGLRYIPPVVLVRSGAEASFRVEAQPSGERGVVVAGVTLPSLPSPVSPAFRVESSGATSSGLEALMNPSLEHLPDGSPISAASYQLERSGFEIGLGRWSWIPVFLLFSLLGALVGGLLLKVRV